MVIFRHMTSLVIKIAFSGELIFDPASFFTSIPVHDSSISHAIVALCCGTGQKI